MPDDVTDDRRAIERQADSIVLHILDPDYPLIDIALERNALRETCERLNPGRMWIYDMIFESRFDRLIEQWRGDGAYGGAYGGAYEPDPDLPSGEWSGGAA